MEESAKFAYLLTISNTEPDVNPIVFVIEPAVENSIVKFVLELLPRQTQTLKQHHFLTSCVRWIGPGTRFH